MPTRRATRKPLLYDLLERWYQPDLLGLDWEERMQLESEGHERWLKRGRLTAEMTVALLDHTLISWEAMGEERPRHPADERSRIVWRLRGQMAAQANVDREHRECLLALERLERHVANHGGPHFTIGVTGKLQSLPESAFVEREWRAIQQRFPALITTVRNELVRAATSENRVPLTDRIRIAVGENQRHADAAAALRAELGRRFLSPTATIPYRASRVRKWRQLAARRRQT
jgi:hypothetical protein